MDFATEEQRLYEGKTFKGVVNPQREIRFKEFDDCTFIHCSFNETHFQECVFRNCTFRDCDLSLMQVKSSAFSGVKFEGSKVIGVNWSDANWKSVGLLAPSIDFVRCTINYSTFIGLSLKKAQFAQCIAHDVDFTETDLTQANCSDTDFAESRFSQTNLTEANFTHASNYVIDVHFNKVKNATFSLPEAMSLLYSLGIHLVE